MVKMAFEKILERLRSGSVEVTYWDGQTKTYGQGEPKLKLKINDPKALGHILKHGDLGVGEAYSDGGIEVDSLDNLIHLYSKNRPAFAKLGNKLRPYRRNTNVKSRQQDQISSHYDLGNDFYRTWLDETMTYTCAYFRTPKDTLEQAQTQKIDHVLRKLQLQKGQSVLDIGCGWGHLLIRAAKKYGASGLGVTLSREQYKFATQMAKDEGVDKLVKFEHLNYQDLRGRGLQFDRVVSVGVLEHVGKDGLKTYFDVVDECLKPGGVSVLHAITAQTEGPLNSWLDKYIFPGAYTHTVRNIVGIMPEHDFYLLDYENLRYHYYLTCYEWLRRFDKQKEAVVQQYGEKFYRTWRFYLACCGSSFHYGLIDLSQFVFSKDYNNDLPLTREHIYK